MRLKLHAPASVLEGLPAFLKQTQKPSCKGSSNEQKRTGTRLLREV